MKYLNRFRNKRLFLLGFTITIIFISSLILYFYSVSSTRQSPINLVLWVWERPENLYFMKKVKVTYAFLAGTTTKTNEDLIFYSRHQPLRIPDNSKTIAVVRIEDRSNCQSNV